MDNDKSLDVIKLVCHLIMDVGNVCGLVFNTKCAKLTCKKLVRRTSQEGIGFLTKTLPKLGKAFDKALAGAQPLNCTELGFKPYLNTKLPRFLGELFIGVLDSNGVLLPDPDTKCIQVIRQILYLLYKYELPFTNEQEQKVISKFTKTEEDLSTSDSLLPLLEVVSQFAATTRRCPRLQNLDAGGGETSLPVGPKVPSTLRVAREARIILSNVFAGFDPLDIHPRHGPGAVATKQQLWEKYLWTNISNRITSMYPLDAYFYASNGHVCDSYADFESVTDRSLPARVILVPKDSRGPRLISCEPVDFQWIQQGLGRAIVRHVELSPVTATAVNFTDQGHNRDAALIGSISGKYATLDLNEASDRVSLALVRLLFPEHIVPYLEACRSSSTVLPDGSELELRKFAPMGSCLCFPILALTTFAILAAGAPDAYTRERILVYGDDVIVPTAYAANAIELLESFGLKVNRDKSCISGLFRESCGMDAIKGVNVTPVRIRTVWSSLPAASPYVSWIAYANSLYDKGYYQAYEYIVRCLWAVFGPIPEGDVHTAYPSLRYVPNTYRTALKTRWNRDLQKVEVRVREAVSPSIRHSMDGWSMLLRYFSECTTDCPGSWETDSVVRSMDHLYGSSKWSASVYTERRASYLAWRWR